MAAVKGKKTVMKGAAGKPAVRMTPGGLHKSVGVPQGQRIPAATMAAAVAGKYGPKAKKQAVMAQGMLKAGRQTAARNRSRKGS